MTNRRCEPPPRSARVAASLGLAVLLSCAGCGTPADEVRVAVRGNVTLDGKPLQAAAIVFHCGEDDETMTAFGFVENGAYQIAAGKGPRVGLARVELRPKPIDYDQFEAALDAAGGRPTKHKLNVVEIPPQYGARSKLTAEVTLDGENTFDFELASRR